MVHFDLHHPENNYHLERNHNDKKKNLMMLLRMSLRMPFKILLKIPSKMPVMIPLIIPLKRTSMLSLRIPFEIPLKMISESQSQKHRQLRLLRL